MSKAKTAAQIAAKAARHAVANPTEQNLKTAHAKLQAAQAEGATDAEFQAAAAQQRRA